MCSLDGARDVVVEISDWRVNAEAILNRVTVQVTA